MQTNHESKGPAILFLGAWWALSQYAPLADYAFITAIGLMAILWLAVKFAGRAVFRVGRDGWFLIAQVAAWFGLFLWFVPAGAVTKSLVWGIGALAFPCSLPARALGLGGGQPFPNPHFSFHNLFRTHRLLNFLETQ